MTSRGAEDNIRHIAEAIQDAFWLSNAACTEIIYVNSAYEKIWGRSCQSLYEKPCSFLDAVHADDRPQTQTVLEKSPPGEALKLQYRIVRPDSSLRWISTQRYPVMDSSGNVIRLIHLAQDNTERRGIEDALQEKARLAMLIADVNSVLSGDKNLVDTLQACVELIVRYLDFSFAAIWCAEAQSQTLELKAVTDVQGNGGVPGSMISEVTETRRCSIKLGVPTRPGNSVKENSVVSTVYPLLVDERLVGVLALQSTSPCTGPLSHALETLARSLALGISRKCIEQARANLEEQLRQAQKMDAVGQLAGGIAHDFNNILTIVNARSQLLMSAHKHDSKTMRDLELIYKSGERAAALTRQLLAFSRQQVLEPRVLDLNSIISNMQKLLRRLIREDIALSIVPGSTIRPVKADPGQIEQVIFNLVVNARDAMPRGGSLVLETFNEKVHATDRRNGNDAKPGCYTVLSVSDNGCGISADILPRIFEPFFTTKEKTTNTGLGLSTAYGIVKQSGGHITVNSVLERGTCFKIYLPHCEGAVASYSSSMAPAVCGGNEVILVVEDEESVRELVHDLLGMYGYQVLEASDGLEALRICEGHATNIDMVLSDVVMPGMGGPEMAEHILKRRPNTKILFTSGYTDHPIINKGVSDATINFLRKPFTPAGLACKVREVLDVTK
ncbi:MAG TPA: ATP-binding protein [Planctomycetota bacterium]|nr:ATP-binding protein [Planctomycetota bacterium]